MPPDLDELIQASKNLGILEVSFTYEEIDLVVSSFASDKTPGLDGFNNDFIKKTLAYNSSKLLQSM